MIDSASILLIFFSIFHCVRSYFYQGKEGNGEALHFYVFAEVHHLQITILHIVLFEEGRLSSDKASKIMALTATSPSPQILFVYIPGFNPFSVWVQSLLQCGYSSPAQFFAKRWALIPSILHVSWVQVPPLRSNACIQLRKVYTGICQQEEDVADRFHTC